MKIKAGIVGYGNLGKAIEKKIKERDEYELVAIFSKRNLSNTVDYEEIEKYKDKIDVLFLCGGSQNELEKQGLRLIENFNIVDSYDNHTKLRGYINKIDTIAKKNKRVALCSFGWDPGLFSYMRGLFDILGFTPYTFWGKGLSQGHTQAIKNIKGVVDAIQFTIPNSQVEKRIKQGEEINYSKSFHNRFCYVVAKPCDRERIKKEIVSMPDYFEGYQTKVYFVSQKRLDQLKNFAHRGEVITQKNIMNFSLNLPSNPEFTANVNLSYALAIVNLLNDKQYGAYTIMDLPLSRVIKKDKFEYL